jgi:hypothetical protein
MKFYLKLTHDRAATLLKVGAGFCRDNLFDSDSTVHAKYKYGIY